MLLLQNMQNDFRLRPERKQKGYFVKKKIPTHNNSPTLVENGTRSIFLCRPVHGKALTGRPTPTEWECRWQSDWVVVFLCCFVFFWPGGYRVFTGFSSVAFWRTTEPPSLLRDAVFSLGPWKSWVLAPLPQHQAITRYGAWVLLRVCGPVLTQANLIPSQSSLTYHNPFLL